ncbi:MAG: hypothetical protein NXI30_07275 [bacterium]|nr:hypothetical protein [bacterium]
MAATLACSFFGVVFGSAAAAQTGPEVDLHDLTWFVHVDLIDPGAGEDLVYWSNAISEAVDQGNQLLQGSHGPADNVCCAKLGSSVAVSTFGSPDDGLDVIDSLADQQAIAALGSGMGSSAFLVDSLTYCSGSSPGAIGCALRPNCSANANDDPNLWMMVTVDAFEDETLGAVIAHERGHNSCLQHVSTPTCALMQASVFTPGLAGCISLSECTSIRNARTEVSSGEFCTCHDGSGSTLADGALCDANGGVCSGGCCGPITGDAGVRLLAAGGPGEFGFPPEEALTVSPYTGGWSSLGTFAPTNDDVRGLAYAWDSGTLYGIVPTTADDALVTIDPDTGQIVSWVGAIANGTDEFINLAYDPGPTAATTDDRLLAVESEADPVNFGQVRSIDPANPNTSTLLGQLGRSPSTAFSGAAFHPGLNKLFLASPFGNTDPEDPPLLTGIWEIDMSACQGGNCTPTQRIGQGLFWNNASLAYSPDTEMLYAVGEVTYNVVGGGSTTVSFYNVIDPTTISTVETQHVDRFTPAGLASVPEPGLGVGLLLGAGLLARLRRSRRS